MGWKVGFLGSALSPSGIALLFFSSVSALAHSTHLANRLLSASTRREAGAAELSGAREYSEDRPVVSCG